MKVSGDLVAGGRSWMIIGLGRSITNVIAREAFSKTASTRVFSPHRRRPWLDIHGVVLLCCVRSSANKGNGDAVEIAQEQR